MVIRREIEVTRKGLPRPIDVTYGTNILPIEFIITDFELPEGATAEVYAMGRSNKLVKQSCVISKNIISFIPEIGLFEEGKNVLQLAATYAGKDLFSFYIPVNCQKTMVHEGAQDLENDPTFVAMVMKMKEDIANKITLPAIAAVGQILEVEKVDDTGKPTSFIAVDKPTGSGEGGAGAVELTQAEYDNLSEEDKMKDVIYFVADTDKLVYKGKDYGGSVGSNPNLLINGDFQVNQRGQASYNIQNNSWTWVYTLDRWRLYGLSNLTVTKNTDGTITITNNSGTHAHFAQPFEKPFVLGNYVMSANVLNVSGDVYLRANGVTTEIDYKLSVGVNSSKINLAPDSISLFFNGNSSITLEWVKLESGTVATPFIPRHYTEEFIMCRYYYYAFEDETPILRQYNGYTGTISYLEMRVVPTVKSATVSYINTSNQHVQASSTTATPYSKVAWIDFTASNMHSNCYGMTVKLVLDAEIY